MAVITPKDIENPARKSGYDHVYGPRADRTNPAFYARRYGGTLDKAGRSWQGSRRRTAIEAAQDYCDYINGNNVSPAPTLKSAGHSYSLEREHQDPEVAAAYGVIRDAKAQKAGKQGYVYLICEKATKYGKIGYSVNPEKRIAEIQTGNPRQLELVGKIEGKPEDEAAMHAKYIEQNVLQEWFTVTPELKAEFV